MKRIIFILPLFLISCSSISLVSSWKSPDTVIFDANKVLIVGLTHDEEIRNDFESKIFAEFEKRDIESMRSIDMFDIEFTSAEKSENELDEFEQLLLDRDFDAILFTKVLGAENQTTLGQKIDKWVTSLYGTFHDDYLNNQRIYHENENHSEYVVYYLETSLYCICLDKDRELIWRGSFEATDPKKIGKAVEDYVKLVVIALEEQNLIFRQSFENDNLAGF